MVLKQLLCWLGIGLLVAPVFGQTPIDVQHYHLAFDFSSASDKKIVGKAGVRFKALQAVSEIELDLAALTVSTVIVKAVPATFTQTNDKLMITLPTPLNTGDTTTVWITYSGTPRKPSDFGGFYIDNRDYTYNLGVSLTEVPHNYGKVWFPCRDNFTDKATFSFAITTDADKTAVCSGMLDGKTTEGNLTRWNWSLKQPIPTYLASIAVGNYEALTDTFMSVSGKPIEISIYVPPAKVKAAEKTFKNLKPAVKYFEQLFGAYRWPRVGYVAVPMQGGAMEHACNIAFPLDQVDGTQTHDALWAHELAHSWFGNLVTCHDGKDMWLNEGFARYAEVLYAERFFGYDSAKKIVQGLISRVMATEAKPDFEAFALNNAPDKYTYSGTVYDKGATVVHNLRYTLRDEQFFPALQTYFEKRAFGTISSRDFCQQMSELTKTDLSGFCDTWINQPGNLVYSIDHFSTEKTGDNYTTQIGIGVKRLGKTGSAHRSQVEVMIIGKDNNRSLRSVQFTGDRCSFSVKTKFEPVTVLLDPEGKLADARIAQSAWLLSGGSAKLSPTGLSVKLGALKTEYLYLGGTRYFTTPDQMNLTSKIAPKQYWLLTCEENLPGTLTIEAGVRALFGTGIPATFMLYHRPNRKADWQPLKAITPNGNNLTADLDKLQPGEYAIFGE